VKRIPILLATTALVVFATSGVAGAKHSTTVKLSKTSLGKILVSGSGRTLYMFTRDARNNDRCARISTCLSAARLDQARQRRKAGYLRRSSALHLPG
jgi:predicted lipoprotein with Yx(FWY)xxD motif